jgi:hypothetical protein
MGIPKNKPKMTNPDFEYDEDIPVFGAVDPWVHRSKGMRCATCMWCVEKGKLGRCHRRSPTMNGYPVIFPNDWCGDHKLDETKLHRM